MYKDVITYKLAEGISEEHLLKIGNEVFKSWMKGRPGFIKWEIHKNDHGEYTDIIYWESKKSAKDAEADMMNIPNVNDWLSCYRKNSIFTQTLNQIATFNNQK